VGFTERDHTGVNDLLRVDDVDSAIPGLLDSVVGIANKQAGSN
jgi:hypothetical protein